MQLTPEAKIASDFYLIRAIFAVVGFVSALTPLGTLAEGGVRHYRPSFYFGRAV